MISLLVECDVLSVSDWIGLEHVRRNNNDDFVARGDEDDWPASTFEEELALFESEETETQQDVPDLVSNCNSFYLPS